jgi:peptide/nickel transport system ATP-binding protein
MRAVEISGGDVLYHDEDGKTYSMASAGRDELRLLRKRMRMIFQDPYSSLNARMTVRQILAEPLLINRISKSRRKINKTIAEIMEKVGLDPKYMERYPHAFSGGQRQRIAIARSLILDPKFIVADEPVSALDVSIQAQILNLLAQVKRDFNLTYIFIAHNLTVVRHVSNRVAVMYMGSIVELADTLELFEHPLHPYTEALLSAVPVPDPDYEKDRIRLEGEVGNMMNPPSGCLFHPRCSYAQERCRRERPQFMKFTGENGAPHLSACHFSGELALRGIKYQNGGNGGDP